MDRMTPEEFGYDRVRAKDVGTPAMNGLRQLPRLKRAWSNCAAANRNWRAKSSSSALTFPRLRNASHDLAPGRPDPIAVRGRARIPHFAGGVFRAKDGRPAHLPGWKIDAEIAQRVIAASASVDELVIDYEHQTINAERTASQRRPPAGSGRWFGAKVPACLRLACNGRTRPGQ
ncbi:MAG: hypothetical protein HT580_03130 [Dechloromonas sp.]|nr:MAG: hypothetical protein HT580_03130 [Dechloromonas sp.]